MTRRLAIHLPVIDDAKALARRVPRAPNPGAPPPVSIATRRTLFGTVGALMLLTDAEAGQGKAAEVDAEPLVERAPLGRSMHGVYVPALCLGSACPKQGLHTPLHPSCTGRRFWKRHSSTPPGRPGGVAKPGRMAASPPDREQKFHSALAAITSRLWHRSAMRTYVAKPGSIGRKLWVVIPLPTSSDPDPKFIREYSTEREAAMDARRWNEIEAEIARKLLLKEDVVAAD
jgi:hypothetical protein